MEKVRNKTTIIFDFDGTIGDSLDFFVDFLTKEANKFKYDLDKEEVRKMIRNESLQVIMKKYKFSKLHVAYIVWKLRKDFKSVVENVQIFDGINDLIKDLSQKYELYLLTSNDKKHIEKIFEKNGLNKYFRNKYFKSSLFGKDKNLKKIIKENKLEKDDIIYIGDELRDFEACQKAEIDCINVSYGFNSKKLLSVKNKKLVIESVDELRKILL